MSYVINLKQEEWRGQSGYSFMLKDNESIVHLVLVTFIRVLQILTQPLVFSKRARLAQQDKFLWKSTTLDFISDINVITFLRPTPFFSSGMAITYNATKHFSLSFFF